MDWKKSDHYLAMQPAQDSTVLGDFNNATFVADGVTSRFFKKEGKFYINTEGDDGKNHDYEVLYAFGYYPLQQYLLALPGGRMQATRVGWDAREKKWFHQYAGQKIYHHDWLHWTGNSQNWNTMCASCHSTDLQKNYDYTQDAYHTTWHEINVSCESCHGPGSEHIRFINSPEYKDGDSIKNSGLLYAKDANPQLQLNTCAPCHARKADLSQALIHSDEILDDMIPQVISNEFYFADGQINSEDYEYGSFAQSKMFHNNVRCSNCHNPHSGKLMKVGNDLCLSCHKPSYNTKEHHFHAPGTESAQCINCHMPVKTFMGNDHRRDHSFRIPRPDQSIVYETPNTCTGCHKGKSPAWAADAIKKWYGPTRAYHFSDDLLPGSRLTDKSEQHLIKLLRDTAQPEIARATAVYYLSNIQTRSSADALMQALQDKKALVRYHAVRALQNFPPEVWQQTAWHNLTDRVRAVRIAAADLYRRLPQEAIPAGAGNVYFAADAENKKYLEYQTDFAIGNVMLADYELQGGEHIAAISHYLRGLKKDSLMNYARFNLSAAYNSIGKNTEALKTLKEAAAIDPKNDRIYYNLGLLYYELGDIPSTLENFQKSARLGSLNPGLYYNYGLLLQQQKKLKEAEQILLKGFSLDPNAANINYALAYLYMSQNLPKKARPHAETLRRIDPANPDYQVLFKNLGL
ncbi:MAG TPA: tetratricopeptide repeat protein [Saprospiraceae bacterium]|nr:tetratricopeptide repeat protein [Saprospiraceae bacterium]